MSIGTFFKQRGELFLGHVGTLEPAGHTGFRHGEADQGNHAENDGHLTHHGEKLPRLLNIAETAGREPTLSR